MTTFNRLAILGIAAIACLSTAHSARAQAKSAILFIGDGMGLAQVTAARIFEGNARDGKLTLDTMDYTALVRTYSADRLVTDSAAAGTALASGVKTNNGMVGVVPGGQSVATVLELAKAAGKSVGLVTTTTITHATPACFYAHVPRRNVEAVIAAQLVDSGEVDVILGGGRVFFLPQGSSDPESDDASRRKDDRDLLSEMARKGYRVVRNSEEFEAASADFEKVSGVSKILGLFSPGMMAYEAQRGNDKWGEPSIAEMTELAIKVLSKNPNGYFLMVEGGRIDHAGHGNQAYLAVTDLIAFDKALKVAKDLTGPDNSTLIVVTADHETGGLAINGYPPIGIGGDRLFTEPSSGSTPHIVTFATGPGADGGNNGEKKRSDPAYRQPSVFQANSAAHTGVDVAAWASGPGAEVFRGTMENSDVGLRIMEALGLH